MFHLRVKDYAIIYLIRGNIAVHCMTS